jgi:hypothetical protein
MSLCIVVNLHGEYDNNNNSKYNMTTFSNS